MLTLAERVLQRRADLVDVELDDGALLALAGLERALLEPAGRDDAHAAGQRLGAVLGGLAPDRAAQEQRFAVLPLVGVAVELRGVDAIVNDATAAPDGVKRSSGSAVRLPTTVMRVSPAIVPTALGAQDLGPQHRLVEVELAVQLLDGGGLGLQIDDGVDALDVLVDLVGQAAPAPDVDLLDDPPSFFTTFRNASRDGAMVRSSRLGSRMTMTS